MLARFVVYEAGGCAGIGVLLVYISIVYQISDVMHHPSLGLSLESTDEERGFFREAFRSD